MGNMILTAREIKDLAEYALGITIDSNGLDGEDSELDDYEYTVSECPEKGVLNDDGSIIKSNYVVTCDGCDGNECSPLGNTEIIGYDQIEKQEA